MEKQIYCVEKGTGEQSCFFTTNDKASTLYYVDRIIESSKQISCDKHVVILVGYIGDKVKFEMGFNEDVTITYK
jgi:hypothetical protein